MRIPPKLLLFTLCDIFLGFEDPEFDFDFVGLQPRGNVDVAVVVRARAGVEYSYEMRSEWISASLSVGEDVQERWGC